MDKIDRIINDTENLIKNFDRFYTGKLYIDKNVPEKAVVESVGTIETVEAPKPKVRKPAANTVQNNKSAVAEIDIFGNENIKREEWEFAESLDELNSKINTCMKCGLGKTRTNFVFGVGNPKADVVVIGEAPGADEDSQGEPFVGKAGQLLNKILEATGFSRDEVFILNILKCRPPGNRNPAPDEVELCRPYLEKQLKLINPKLILLLGKVASESLLKTKEPLNKLRGKTHDYKGWKVRVTFHPAALLRNPNWKRPTWEDMLEFKALYEEMTGKKIVTGSIN
ncbi:MAG TPA: uracil-DNA glycosylase [Ignavibacteria bacterium]|nr:uracil-DNA glycosylase [Bacteroidota bacterium]HRE12300.1 uracil-DNA glycosylase [Ignavibacteria bacterium]HRF67141.1 uracil-DNA glycosylase [Ignavibacteria bacterium]HRJ04425.1 uracil-DNA glycosylase [Ignavibacteria bacterium]